MTVTKNCSGICDYVWVGCVCVGLARLHSSQCSTYQAQCPASRVIADRVHLNASADVSGRSSAIRAPNYLPNFYSASLCRKPNATHLKKYARSRPRESLYSAESSTHCLESTESSIGAAAAFLDHTTTAPAAAGECDDDPDASSIAAVLLEALSFRSQSNKQETRSASSLPVNQRASPAGVRPKTVFAMFMQHQYSHLREYLQSAPIVRRIIPARCEYIEQLSAPLVLNTP
jgi:hypothetical protein